MNAYQDTVARTQPQHCAAARGWGWIADGWALFKANAGVWIGIFVIWMVLQFALNLIPLAGLVLGVLGPVFSGGILFAARDQESNQSVGVGHLFAGFQSERFGQLALLGALQLLLFVLLAIVVAGVMFMSLGGMDFEQMQMPGPQMLVGLLLFLVLTLPLVMAIWFSTSLVALHDATPVQALKLSFSACLQNIGSLTLFSLVIIPLGLLAVIPFGLGLLVLAPVAMLAMYRAYIEIFRKPADEPDYPSLG